MSVFGPINTERTLRRFGALDLEWVPGEVLPMPERTTLDIEGISTPLVVNLPAAKTRTRPLELRLAGYYDQQPEKRDERAYDSDNDSSFSDSPVMVERYESFKTIAELIDFMLVREHRGMWFYAHAGGLFDMEFVLDELLNQIKEQLAVDRNNESLGSATPGSATPGSATPGSATPANHVRSQVVWDADNRKREETIVVKDRSVHKGQTWTIKASFSGSSAIIIHVTKGKDTWHFVDSYWLFRDKLSKIGESIGIKKKDEEKRRTPEETRLYFANTPLSELIPYNKVDCEILWKAVAKFEEELMALGGQLQQTIASTAMNLFRRAHMKTTIHTSEAVNQIAVQSYFASRVEVFQRHVTNANVFDINSSFPFSMTFPLPANLIAMGDMLPEEDSDECLYMADVTIEVPDMDIPPLPFRTTEDSRVFFPTGRWRSWFTSTDIRLALREGCKVHAVHECYQFEPFWDFARYAKKIYALRAAADSPFRKLLLKYLLNSLYGKAAESLLKQEMLINPSEDDLNRETMQMLQPGIWLQEKEAPIAHRHVIVSSVITALSRRLLFDYIKMCGSQGKPAYYSDTDSICTQADLPTDSKELGKLKLEKRLDWAEFVAPKIYRGEGDELKGDGTWKNVRLAKAKGFSLGKFDNPLEALGKIIDGEQVGVQTMVRMRELYQSGDPTKSESSPYEKLTIKALTQRMLSKRYQYPDGNTRPWTVKEILSGDHEAKGFDFSEEFLENLDANTRSMLAAAV